MHSRGPEVISYQEWIQDPSNTEVIGGTVVVSDKYHIGPASYHRRHYPNWGTLRNTEVGEFFLLTERTFKGTIDSIFRRLPSQIITELMREGRRPDILDVGGGKDGLTARDVARVYPQSLVTNVDIVALPGEEGNFKSIQADILELPLRDESFDLVYTHQVLPYLNPAQEYFRHRRVLGQIVRVLRPGGVAIVDDGSFSALEPKDHMRRILEEEIGADVFLGEKRDGNGFLFVAKDSVNPDIAELIEKTGLAA